MADLGDRSDPAGMLALSERLFEALLVDNHWTQLTASALTKVHPRDAGSREGHEHAGLHAHVHRQAQGRPSATPPAATLEGKGQAGEPEPEVDG
jgi:hypothetical protein